MKVKEKISKGVFILFREFDKQLFGHIGIFFIPNGCFLDN